ncbi:MULTISPECIES: helix-turn-helix domain-containing protein [unclassified Minwuia]|jgi:transcriptional regulator with XRE-family HTH domain|uniref:helix-turn-helix domain-containing protein n=1 Tax=unclassified Minwuia TaxID=2618799 RepID=UPI002479CD22|nr:MULTISPECIES: helix-turn-helix domain-containing protein [unclassified Minwuia]
MTPFGTRVRALRERQGLTLSRMAADLQLTPAYLSALEHGHRSRPSWSLVQQIIDYFNLIWEDADDLRELARMSHPRVVIDTAGLSAKATLLANRLAAEIAATDERVLDEMLTVLDRAERPDSAGTDSDPP